MAKADIKVCRYNHCKHSSKEIDVTKDEYIVKNRMYFHKDCYKAKTDGEWKNEQTKADLQLIRSLWEEHISRSVVYSQLYKSLNELLERGISSDYLVFVMLYIVDHHMNLNYPAGFKYFVDRKEIKDAYDKKKAKEIVGDMKFVAVEKNDAPKFSINNKPKAFQNILSNK